MSNYDYLRAMRPDLFRKAVEIGGIVKLDADLRQLDQSGDVCLRVAARVEAAVANLLAGLVAEGREVSDE